MGEKTKSGIEIKAVSCSEKDTTGIYSRYTRLEQQNDTRTPYNDTCIVLNVPETSIHLSIS